MSPDRPRLRPLEVAPEGRGDEARMVLRDREGWTPPVTLPPGAVLLASLMDGTRTLAEIRAEYFALAGLWWTLEDLDALVRRLDSAFLLEGPRFDEFRRPEVQRFLRDRVRPPAGAGTVYPVDPEKLRQRLELALASGTNAIAQLADLPRPLSTEPGERDAVERIGAALRALRAAESPTRLRGLATPVGALDAMGRASGAAFRRLADESDAELFVLLGTSRRPLREPFCLLTKDLDTPLGRASVDRDWIEALAGHFAASRSGSREPLFHDVLAHRTEVSIELSLLFLQHALDRRGLFRVVPVLLGGLEPPAPIDDAGTAAPLATLPDVAAFVAAARRVERESPRRVCYLLAADLAEADWRDDRPANADRSRPSVPTAPRRGRRALQLLAALAGATSAQRLLAPDATEAEDERPTAGLFYGPEPERGPPPAAAGVAVE